MTHWLQERGSKMTAAIRRHACTCGRCESPRRRYAGMFWLAIFVLAIAHGWLHLASNDRDGHFAHNDSQCCLVESLGGGTAPPVIDVALPNFVPIAFTAARNHESYSPPVNVGYSPRDPPIA
ncbi:MAG: hypothetical protein WAN51_14350 [Alphaproteobacteria bacterium]